MDADPARWSPHAWGRALPDHHPHPAEWGIADPVGAHENTDGTSLGASEPEYSERDEPGLFDVVMAWAAPLAIVVGGWTLVVVVVRRWRK